MGCSRRTARGARSLKRVFGIEIEGCARCGGRLAIIASVEEPQVIALGSRVIPGGLDAELAAVTGVVIDAEKGVGYFSGAFLAPQPIIVERRCDIDMGGRKSNTAQPDTQQFFPWIEGAPLRYFAGERISGGDTIAHVRFEIDGSYGDIIDVPKPAHIVVDWKLTKR